MTCVSPVTLYLPSMIGSCIFGIFGLYKIYKCLSVFSTLSYAEICVADYFLWYVKSDNLLFFTLHFIPNQGLSAQ